MENKHPTDPFESLEGCIAFGSLDWSQDKRLAWMYGIICGWEDALPELAERFGWGEVEVARLKQLRLDFKFAHRLWQDNR